MCHSFLRQTYVYFVLLIRWLLLPLLFYIAGQYLEGPPYRVIVRSVPFILACFALSILAAQYLRQRSSLPLLYYLYQALLVPGGFIFVIQNYYNGGINGDYSLAILFFAILMGLNGILYSCSLFSFRRRPQPTKLNTKPGIMKSYDIKLHCLDHEGNLGKVKYHDQGTAEPPEAIIIEGFSEARYIDLRGYWTEILAAQIEEYRTAITTRETIIKFGDTVQLVDEYELVMQVTYEN
ncbi:MAG: hypothetical protein KAU22_05425 [Desulfuromonadales bacterium]|nr:hypothetical protein [Desulfuromonadales bacterium]